MSADATEHLVERFARVFRLFDGLKSRAYLQRWEVLPPSEGKVEYRLEGEPVWPLPTKAVNEYGVTTKRPWAIVNKSIRRPRCAMIVQLTNACGQPLYWFEVEPSILTDQEGDENAERARVKARGFRSLILTREPEGLERTLKAALLLCVQHRGIWPEPREIIRCTGARAATCWTHHSLGSGELSDSSALKAIDELAARR
jgi:hypothetical protein